MIINSEYRKQISDSGTLIDITNFGIRATHEVLVTKFDGTSESTLAITTNYTINSDLDTITLNSALTSGESAVATLNISDDNSVDYKINSSNNAEVLEGALDKVTLNVKKKQERLDRVVAKQVSDINPGISFASFTDKANFFAQVNTPETQIDFSAIGGATLWSDYTLPAGDGTADQLLKTDGNSTLAWTGQADVIKNSIHAYCEFKTGDQSIIRRSSNVVHLEKYKVGRYDVRVTPNLGSLRRVVIVSLTQIDPSETKSLFVNGYMPSGSRMRAQITKLDGTSSAEFYDPAGDTRILIMVLDDVIGLTA